MILRTILRSSTHPRWFAAGTADLQALLSDHLHCERKAAESSLMLVRRYPHRGTSVAQLSRLAHEETSHVVQVAALLARRGWMPRTDTPNRYARALLDEVRGREPERLLDALLVSAFIEARSHERRGATTSWPASTRRWATPRSGTPRSSWSWRSRWSRPKRSTSGWPSSASARPRSWPACRTPAGFTDYDDTSSRPMIDPISVVRKNTRQGAVESPKKAMPMIAVPKAPRPVQTA